MMRLALTPLLLVAAFAPAAEAQWLLAPPPAPPARTFVGGGLTGVRPVGAFRDSTDAFGYGVGGHFIHALGSSRLFAIRASLDIITYGRERVPLRTTVPRLRVDVVTSNNIVSAGIGPQIMLPDGKIRPYLGGTVGFSYFYTESEVSGIEDYYDFASTTHHDDWTLAWTASGGLYIPLRKGPRPISLDLGAIYHHIGMVKYLREGSITDTGNGGVDFTPIRGDANLIAYRIGVSIGVH